jgi:hypothetical protein
MTNDRRRRLSAVRGRGWPEVEGGAQVCGGCQAAKAGEGCKRFQMAEAHTVDMQLAGRGSGCMG